MRKRWDSTQLLSLWNHSGREKPPGARISSKCNLVTTKRVSSEGRSSPQSGKSGKLHWWEGVWRSLEGHTIQRLLEMVPDSRTAMHGKCHSPTGAQRELRQEAATRASEDTLRVEKSPWYATQREAAWSSMSSTELDHFYWTGRSTCLSFQRQRTWKSETNTKNRGLLFLIT